MNKFVHFFKCLEKLELLESSEVLVFGDFNVHKFIEL